MRRALAIVVFIAAVCLGATAQDRFARFNGSCQQGGSPSVTNGIESSQPVQLSYPACTVTVIIHGSISHAALFVDAAGTIPLTNPFTATSKGVIGFYAADGRYDVQLSGGGIVTPFTISDVLLCFTCSGGGGGGGTPITVNGGLVLSSANFQGGVGGTIASNPSANNIEIDLPAVIAPGSCTNCNITFDAFGRTTVASNGSSGGGGANPGGAPTQDQFQVGASQFGGKFNSTYNATTGETNTGNLNKIRSPNPLARASDPYNFLFTDVAGAIGNLTIAGAGKTLTMPCTATAPCLGFNTSNNAAQPYSVYVATTGTPEAALVTGGTCTIFATASCTLVVTTVNTHANGFTVQSAYGGIQEAMNEATSPNAKIILQPVGANTNAYQVFAPIFMQNQRSVLDAEGSFVKCFTRSMCLVLGDLLAVTNFLDIRVHGLRIAAGINIPGVTISNTERAGCPGAGTCQINITTASPHPFVVGDYVDIQMSNNTTYWGIWKVTSVADNTHFSCLISSLVNNVSNPSTNIASAASIGQVGLANSGIWDNSEGTVIDEVQFESGTAGPAPTGNFHNGIVVFNDQEAVIQNPDFASGSAFTCDATYCANAIYLPGPFSPNAAVLNVRGRELTLGCKANGITDYAGNTLGVNDIVIQGYPQWSINAQRVRGGFGTVTAHNVYNEVGNCDNPNYSGSLTAGRAEAGMIGPATVRGGEFPTGNTPLFDCVGGAGANSLYYWIIIKDSVLGTSAPLFAGNTSSACSGNVTVQWPRVQGTNTVTYDIVRMGTVGAPGITGPSVGNCGGGTVIACGSAATAQAQCSAQVCSFTDDSAANTSSYTIVNPNYYPELYFWPGAAVMSAFADTNTPTSVPSMYMDHTNFLTPQSQLVSETAWMMPTYFSQDCTQNTPSTWVACLSAGSQAYGATVLQGGTTTGVLAANLKGRINFNWDQGIPQGAIITLFDSCPSCTFADRNKRPAQSITDMWIGNDKASTSQLTFHAPVISRYISNLDDNANWSERLTATKDEFRVTAQLDSNLSILGTCLTGCGPFTQVNPAADNFDRADGAIGANWTVTDGTFSVASKKAVYTFGGDAHAMAAYSGSAFGNDQCSEVIVDTVSTALFGVMVRGSLVAETGYIFEGTNSSSNIGKVVAGTITNLVTLGPAFADGDAIQLCVQGTALKAYKNFNATPVLSVSDATIASGNPGLWGRNNATGKFDFWSGGDAAWTASQTLNITNAVCSGTCTGFGGTGTVTHTVGSLAAAAIMTGNGAGDSKTPSATTTLDASGNVSTPGTITSTGANGALGGTEGNGTGGGCTAGAGVDCQWMDATDHRWAVNVNNVGKTDLAMTYPSGTVTTAGTIVNAGTCQAQTGITITGALTTDNVVANIGATLPATWQTGIQLSAHVTAASTVTVYLCNGTAGNITPAATAVIVRILR